MSDDEDPTVEQMNANDPVAQEFVRRAQPVSHDGAAFCAFLEQWMTEHPPADLEEMLEALSSECAPDRAVHFVAGLFVYELAAYYGRAVVTLRRSEVLAWTRRVPNFPDVLRDRYRHRRGDASPVLSNLERGTPARPASVTDADPTIAQMNVDAARVIGASDEQLAELQAASEAGHVPDAVLCMVAARFPEQLASYYGRAVVELRRSEVLAWARVVLGPAPT